MAKQRTPVADPEQVVQICHLERLLLTAAATRMLSNTRRHAPRRAGWIWTRQLESLPALRVIYAHTFKSSSETP